MIPTDTTARIGERIWDEYCTRKGYQSYRPPEGCAHPVDRLVFNPATKDFRCAAEIKTKPRREAYADTGINESAYADYQRFVLAHGTLPLFVAFVDWKLGTMYGNWWTELIKTRESTTSPIIYVTSPNSLILQNATYPYFDRGIVYFSLEAMPTLYTLSDAERSELRLSHASRWRADEPVKAMIQPERQRRDVG